MEPTVKQEATVPPIRENVVVLAFKVILLIVIPNLIYYGLRVLGLEIFSPGEVGSWVHWMSLFFMLLMVTFQTFLILQVTLAWANHTFWISKTQIVEESGIFNKKVTTRDIPQLRSVSVKQGLLGRIFNFGSLVIQGKSEDYSTALTIMYVTDPNRYEIYLENTGLSSGAPIT